MTNRLLITALLASALALSACNKNDSTAGGETKAPADPAKSAALPSGPVATVNGEDISSDMFDLYAKSRLGKPASELTPEQKQEVLDQLINLEVAAQTAAKDGLDKQTETVARLELLRINALAEMQVAKKFGDQRPTEQELRAEYEKQIADMPAMDYKASHILVATEPFAQTLIDKIKAGGNFADIAKKESMDSSKERGGDLGWFSPRNMVPAFSKAVTELKKGEMTQKPVKTEFGYHIIRLDDTRPTTTPEFDTVKDRLAQIVQQKKVQAYVNQLKAGMKVEKKI